MKPPHLMTRLPMVRHVFIRPRLMLSLLFTMAVYVAMAGFQLHHPVTQVLVSWNAGAGLYLLLAGFMMARSGPDRMRWRSRLQDDGRFMALFVVIVAALASLLAIAAQLSVARNFEGFEKLSHIGLALLTIVSSWLFTQVMFALHYAHEFYADHRGTPNRGLEFAGEESPDYFDFLYVACVIGTSGQTADVSFSSRSMRRVGLIHCVLSYFFNTVLLALTINVAAGLF